MIYSLLVLSSPVSGHGSRHAVDFARAVLARGHTLRRVFFLDAGTLASSASSVLPQDEEAQISNWVALAEKENIELAICITSALRFGMLDAAEAMRYERAAATINPVFVISGLGELVDACNAADRLVTFGG